MTYALARDLRGFPSTTLRVRIIELTSLYARVVTADLLNAGTKLVLERDQINLLEESKFDDFTCDSEAAYEARVLQRREVRQMQAQS